MNIIQEQQKLAKNIGSYLPSEAGSTPIALVREMVGRVPIEVLKNPTSKFLDPAAGSGTFGVTLLEELQKYHSKDHILNNMIYLIEVRPFKYAILKKLGFVNVYREDFLTKDFKSMKFNVALFNPPFNETDTTRKTTNYKGQGRNLAKLFTQRILEITTDHIIVIQPYGHRTLSSKVERDYIKAGLNRVVNCTKYFPQVAQTLAYFIFDKNLKKEYINELQTTHTVPSSNIAEYFINQPGKLSRFEYEDSLKDSGNVKVFVTTGKQGYIDDLDFHNKMQDKSYGKWRTVFNCTTTKNSIGKVLVATPTDVLSKSVHCLAFDTEEQAIKYREYLSKPETNKLLSEVKTGMCNSKKFLKYIPTID